MAFRVLFAGTPDAAVETLNALLETEHEMVGVLTREDAPQGRKRVLTPSPVAQRAQELNLPVLKANSWSEDVAQQVATLDADIAAVVAYGTILPQEALDLLPQGWINLHFSSLPAWRGAAPVQRALIAGAHEIFSNTFRIEVGLDTGPVFREESTDVSATDTAGEILLRLAQSGGALLSETFADIASGYEGIPQMGQASHAAKLTLADGRIEWNRSSNEVLALYRGVTPEPGAWCEWEGHRFKIGALAPLSIEVEKDGGLETDAVPGTVWIANKKLHVKTADGWLELVQVQPAGKKMMKAADWARGLGSALNEQKVVLA